MTDVFIEQLDLLFRFVFTENDKEKDLLKTEIWKKLCFIEGKESTYMTLISEGLCLFKEKHGSEFDELITDSVKNNVSCLELNHRLFCKEYKKNVSS